MSPGGYDTPSVPSSSTQHDLWRNPTSLSSPYDRSYPSQTRHRSPSPQQPRRYGYDSYVPPARAGTSHREDYPNYPNVYRPNVYRPDPSTYYSRTPSPDRYPTPRHADSNWDRTSPWSSSSKQPPSWQDRKPLPPSPTSTLPRERGRRESMLATRMFEPSDNWKQGHVDRSHRADVSKTPFISERYSEYRARDAKDPMSDRPPRNPYPGGDRYRPPQNYRDNYPPRLDYDSYRPQYDDNWSPEKSETLASTDHGRRDSVSSSHPRSSGRYDAGRSSSSSTLPPLPISPMRSPYRRYSRLSPDRGRRPVPYDDHLPYDSDSSSKGNNSTNNTSSRVAPKSRSRSRSSVASTHVSEQQSASASVQPHIPLSDSSVPVQVTNTSTVAEQKSKANEKSHIEKSPFSVKKVLLLSPVISTIAPNEERKSITAVPDGTIRSPPAPISRQATLESGLVISPVSFEQKVLPNSLEEKSRASSPLSIPGLTISANEQASPLSPVPLEISVTEDATPLSPTVGSSDQIVELEKTDDDVLPSSSIIPLDSIGTSVVPGQHSRDSSIASSRVSSPPPTTVVTEEARPSSPVPKLLPVPDSSVVTPAPASPKLRLLIAPIASPVPAVHEIPAKLDEPPTPSIEKPQTPSLPTSKAPTPPKVVITGPSLPDKSEVPSLSEAKTHAEALRSTVMTRLLCDRQPRESRIDPVLIANLSINHQFLFEFKPGNEAVAVKQVEDLVGEITTGRRHEDVMANSVNVKKTLIQRFEERQEKIKEKAASLKEEYLALHEKWKAHCAALDEQAKAAAAAEAAEHPQQNSGRTTRRSAANLGDAVRSDLEMEQIIASLGNDEATDPNQLSLKNLAVVPDMISVANGKVDSVFDDTSHLVHNPSEYYGTQTGLHDWTEQEKEVLLEKFAAYPKQFGNIAKFLPNKTASQSVNFYYLHKKKHVDFRKVVQQFAPNKRRRRRADKRKERGNGLLADIRQHDDEVHRDGTTSTTINGSAGTNGNGGNSTNGNGAVTGTSAANATPAPAVNGRPTRSRRQASSNSTATIATLNGTASNTDANQGAALNGTESRKPASRRTAIQLEGTPTSTPTPEPEQQQQQRPRRRRAPANTANKTAVHEEQVDDDPTDQDARPAKRPRRTRKVKSAAHVIEEPDGPLSTPQPPSASSFPDSNTNDNIITTSTTKGTESTIANHDANNVGGINLNNNASGPTTRRKVAPATVTWSDEDKKLFLTLLAQYGDEFKRIAASMPNKTTIQVQNYYRLNLVELDLEKVAARAPKRSPTPEMLNFILGNYPLDPMDHTKEIPFHSLLPPTARTLGSNSRSMDLVASGASLLHSQAQARHQLHESPRSVHLPLAGHALSQPQSSVHHQLQQRTQPPQASQQQPLQQPYHQTQHTSQTHPLPPSSSLLHGSAKLPSGGATLPRLPELNRPLDLDQKLSSVGSGGAWSGSSGGSSSHRSPPLKPVFEANHSGPSSRIHSPPGFGLTHGRSHMQPTSPTGPGPLVSPPSYPAPPPSLTAHGGSSQSHSMLPYSAHSAPRHGPVNVYPSPSSNSYPDTSPSQSQLISNYEPRGYPQRQPPPLSLAPPVSSHHHQPQQQSQYSPSTHHQYPTPLPPPSGPRYHKTPFPEHRTPPPPQSTSPPALPLPSSLLAAGGGNSNRRPGVMITKGENPYPVLHRPSSSGTTSPSSNRVGLPPLPKSLPQHPMRRQHHTTQPHPYRHSPQTDHQSAVTSSPPFYRS